MAARVLSNMNVVWAFSQQPFVKLPFVSIVQIDFELPFPALKTISTKMSFDGAK
jgi:hypothetical protein